MQQHVRRILGSRALCSEGQKDRETEVSVGFAISYATITELIHSLCIALFIGTPQPFAPNVALAGSDVCCLQAAQ